MRCDIFKDKEKSTYIHEQRKPGDSLHGQNQERDHGKVSAIRVRFDPGQNLLKGRALVSVESREKIYIYIIYIFIFYLIKRKESPMSEGLMCCRFSVP